MTSLNRLPRIWRTLRLLRVKQISALIINRVSRPRIDFRNTPCFLSKPGNWVRSINKLDSFSLPDRFLFLNEEHRLGADVEWNRGASSYLWHYNLHYFDFLNSVRCRNEPEFGKALICQWVRDNAPLAEMGWDPYPTSLRVINWIKFHWETARISTEAAASVAIGARLLARRPERHLMANHLFTNAKALMFVGFAFEGREAEGCVRKGLDILEVEIGEQFLSDGGHFERCPMYQLILFEDVLDLINLTSSSEPGAPHHCSELKKRCADLHENLCALVPKMSRWAVTMRHPDGDIPLFNDSALGIAPDWAELRAYAARLGLEECICDLSPTSGVTVLNESGFARLSRGEFHLFMDVAGPMPAYQPGHAHAGTLGIELSFDARRVFVDTGISTYEPGANRLAQRGTAAHNTVSVDNADSSEVWSSFRVGHRAVGRFVSFGDEALSSYLIAEHDGYKRLRGVGLHSRSLRLDDTTLEIKDEVRGSGEHLVQARYRLAPGLKLCFAGNAESHIVVDETYRCIFKLEIWGGDAAVHGSTYHPGFGLSEDVEVLVISHKGLLPHSLGIRLHAISHS